MATSVWIQILVKRQNGLRSIYVVKKSGKCLRSGSCSKDACDWMYDWTKMKWEVASIEVLIFITICDNGIRIEENYYIEDDLAFFNTKTSKLYTKQHYLRSIRILICLLATPNDFSDTFTLYFLKHR